MNISERIQTLRKSKNLSQEELANEIGVSRQAVSKWESEQSTPDLDKIIALSEYFNVSTDYLLKGKESQTSETKSMISNGLYVGSSFLVFIGLMAGLSNWNETHLLSEVGGALIIQAVGITSYFIGKIFSSFQASIYLKLMNTMLLLFMPISIIVGYILDKEVAPYPTDDLYILVFLLIFISLSILIYYFLLKKKLFKRMER